MDVVGIVPAAGMGSRLWPYRASKELIQIGYHTIDDNGSARLLPKAAIEHVLTAMRQGGVSTTFIVVSPAKWEIPRYLGNGAHLGLSLAYLCQEEARGMPQALDTAWQFMAGRDVCMGMPDTIIRPDDCYSRLREFHTSHDADLTLGVFPTSEPQALAPVLIEPGTDRVLRVVDKPKNPPVANTWGIATWSARFTDLLHDSVLALSPEHVGEFSLSDVFEAAVVAGMRVHGLQFADAEYHDIGTPEGVVRTRGLLESQRLQLAGR